jgi:hypothetical protein
MQQDIAPAGGGLCSDRVICWRLDDDAIQCLQRRAGVTQRGQSEAIMERFGGIRLRGEKVFQQRARRGEIFLVKTLQAHQVKDLRQVWFLQQRLDILAERNVPVKPIEQAPGAGRGLDVASCSKHAFPRLAKQERRAFATGRTHTHLPKKTLLQLGLVCDN